MTEKPAAIRQPLTITARRGRHVGVNFIPDLLTAEVHGTAFVLVDLFSKMPRSVPPKRSPRTANPVELRVGKLSL